MLRWSPVSDGHTRARVAITLFVLLACSAGDGGSESFGTNGGGEPCTPGEQRGCACPGGAPDGVQVCAASGDRFDACTGCPAADTGSSSGDASVGSSSEADTSADDTSAASSESTTDVGPCAGHCTNGVQDCDEPFTDCGSDCPEVPYYTFCDCMIDTPRNGSEVCDDTGFVVDAMSLPNVLVCLEATGGQIYIATNTSIDPNDQAERCSGWELMGQNPWDYLDYVVPALTCDAEQATMPFDISGYVGQTLWFGAHDHPRGGGSGTTACIAIAK